MTSSYPLVVTLISWFWFGEALTVSVLTGTSSIVAGLVLLNIHIDTRNASGSHHLRGVVSAIFATLSWAFSLTLNKHLISHGVSSMAVTFWRGIFFSLMAMAFLPLVTRGEKEVRRTSVGGVLAAVGAGIIALVIGLWFFSTSLFIIPMNVATPIASSSPLLAAALSCAFMGESLRPAQWFGIVLVVAGAVVVSV